MKNTGNFSIEEFSVKQMVYDDEKGDSQIKIATATEWNNGEGFDVVIERKNAPAIFISMGYEDVDLFRRIFVDMGF